MNPFNILPLDLISHLLLFLSVQEVEGTLSRLNKEWYATINNPKVCKFRKVIWLPAKKKVTKYDNLSDSISYTNNIITDEVLIKLSSKYLQLKEINITSDKVSDIGLIAIANNCNKLEKLFCDDITPTTVITYTRITEKSITSIADYCPNLLHLTISLSGEIIEKYENILKSRCKKFIKLTTSTPNTLYSYAMWYNNCRLLYGAPLLRYSI